MITIRPEQMQVLSQVVRDAFVHDLITRHSKTAEGRSLDPRVLSRRITAILDIAKRSKVRTRAQASTLVDLLLTHAPGELTKTRLQTIESMLGRHREPVEHRLTRVREFLESPEAC